MEKDSINNRLLYIDFGAGIMILWVLIFHAMLDAARMEIEWLNEVGVSFISVCHNVRITDSGILKIIYPIKKFPFFYFFMPWFFYKSGQFFRKREMANLLKSDVEKLLKPFVIYGLVGFVMYLIYRFLSAGELTVRSCVLSPIASLFMKGYIPINAPLWFLLTLIIVRLLANVFLSPNKGNYVNCIAIIVIGYLISYLLYCVEKNFINLPDLLSNTVLGLVFFVLGYRLHKYETKWWLIVTCLIIYLSNCIFFLSIVAMRANAVYTGNYLWYIPCAYAGIVIFNVFCRLVVKWLPKIVHPIAFVGRYAMIIYVTHGLIYASVLRILKVCTLTSLMPYTFWLIIGAYIIFLPPICYFYYRVQQRKLITQAN